MSLLSARVFLLLSTRVFLLLSISALLLLGISAFVLLASCILSLLVGRPLLPLCRLRNTSFHEHPEDLIVLICHVIIKKMIQIEVRQIILIGYLVIFQERLYVIVAEVCHGLRLLVFLLLDFLTSSPLRLLGNNAPKRVFMRHPPSDE